MLAIVIHSALVPQKPGAGSFGLLEKGLFERVSFLESTYSRDCRVPETLSGDRKIAEKKRKKKKKNKGTSDHLAEILRFVT